MRNAIAILLLLVGGCSSCHDGQESSWTSYGTNYSPCKMGCVKGTKTCGCSKQCPCWDKHGVQK